MPYIKQEARDELKLVPLARRAEVPGELNYQISMLIQRYWDAHSNYQGINDVIGALEGAKMEFYRRIAVPYEDQKIQENGDVYE